ncbi:MAG: DUF4202 domain-containing protein [Ilumatobacteraceae bacterium]
MRDLSPRYTAAVAAIDAANADDPNIVTVRGRDVPLALAHGQLAVEWIAQLVDHPDEELLLAARAHHLRRWQVRRDSYPAGRPGYLRWRKDQKVRHAADVAEILESCDFAADEVERVQRLVRREPIDNAQAIEDAACLVFIETQLSSLAARMDHELMTEVIRKTARKMSRSGLDAVASIPLTAPQRALLGAALGEPSA